MSKCIRCGKEVKNSKLEWSIHEDCKTEGEKRVARKLNKMVNDD